MTCKDPPWPWHAPLLAIYLLLLYCVMGTPESDSLVLLKFKESLGNNDVLHNWVKGTTPCPRDGNSIRWVGVLCWNGTVWGLQLENMELTGVMNMDSLRGLPGLRTLSFMHNRFDGPMPDLGKLYALKSFFLSNNHFSGEISTDAFKRMGWLKKVHLAGNGFSGRIPTSLEGLGRLIELRLEENRFIGEIPDFKQPNLRSINVSYNQLEGPIPSHLHKMHNSSFVGNKDLCGEPLNILCKTSSKKSSTTLHIFLILIATAIALVIIIIVIFILLCRRRQSDKIPSTVQKEASPNGALSEGEGGSSKSAGSSQKKSGKDHNQGKLVFFREDKEKFDLRDLLTASAEVLGSGSFGSSYKAMLVSGSSMVVKRFREMNGVGGVDFQEHMRRLGRLNHPNLMPIVAYYYRKDEKLFVTDFVNNGSLVQLLHGNRRSPHRPTLDWPMRLKIIKGVGMGMSYLYNELPILTLPHGHLKSSNVLLDDSFTPILTDYGLAPVMNRDLATQLMVAYKSPEYLQHGQITRKSDVWGLGILILEIMTGKFPESYLAAQGKGKGSGPGPRPDMGWVNSIARAERTDQVFDSEMEGTRNGEMWKLLKIGLHCCEEEVEKRWELKEALERIEELRDDDETNPTLHM